MSKANHFFCQILLLIILSAYLEGPCLSQTNSVLSDAEFLEKEGIDIQALALLFGENEGNKWLRVLGGEEHVSAIGFETIEGYNEKTTKSWLKGIEFKFDKEFSRSVFKGRLPLEFKQGMKLSQINSIIPGAEFEKSHAKKDWFTTYAGKTISESIRLSLTMSFRKGKLGRLVIELDEKTANSREWKILRNKIFSELKK